MSIGMDSSRHDVFERAVIDRLGRKKLLLTGAAGVPATSSSWSLSPFRQPKATAWMKRNAIWRLEQGPVL